MSITSKDLILHSWFLKKRNVKWNLRLGLDKRSAPAIEGAFSVTPHYIDDQGEKWGDTHIRDIGKHYDEYSFWHSRHRMYPLGGFGNTPQFQVSGFTTRKYKSAAHGVTGMIGEVLVATFLQDVMKIQPNEIAFLIPGNSSKAPDIVLDVNSNLFSNLIRTQSKSAHIQKHRKNLNFAQVIDSFNWTQPLPLECKSS